MGKVYEGLRLVVVVPLNTNKVISTPKHSRPHLIKLRPSVNVAAPRTYSWGGSLNRELGQN